MRKTPGRSALDNLCQSEAFPSLGEMAFAANGDHKWRHSGLTKDAYLEWMWEQYDRAFASRVDYRLWRCLFRPLYPSSLSGRWREPLRMAEEGLGSPDPVIVWGILAMMSGFLSGQRAVQYKHDQLLTLAEACDERLFGGLQPVAEGEAGCGMIKALALGAIEQIRYEIYRTVTCEEAGRHLRRLEKSFQEVDPSWIPGEGLWLSGIQDEQSNGRVVLPFRTTEVLLRAIRLLFKARGVVRVAIKEINDESEELLQEAALFALSAWRTARSLRIWEQDWRDQEHPRFARLDMGGLQSHEMQALRRTTQAMRDAGNYALCAGLAHLLLRVIPDDVYQMQRFKGLGNDVSFVIRQAGLEIDTRFQRHTPQRWRPGRRQSDITLDGTTDTGKGAGEPLASNGTGSLVDPMAFATDLGEDGEERLSANDTMGNPPDPFALRIARDKETDPRWAKVLQAYGTYDDPMRTLAFEARGGRFNELETLRGAYSLSLEYGWIARAAQLLKRFTPSKVELLDFAHGIKRALQVMPFGMEVTTHQEWQRILREGWASLPDKALQVTIDEALVVHEVLLGCYLSVVRDAGPQGAKLFAEKYYGVLSEDDIRNAFDTRSLVGRSGPATVITPRFRDFMQKIADSALGTPVCASIITLDTECSLLATSGCGRWISRSLPMSDLRARAEKIQAFHRFWLRKTGLDIHWGEAFTQLGSALLGVAEELDPKARWFVLAVDPALATLPWQALLYRLGRRHGKEIVVSLIPSFSWAALSYEREDRSIPDVQCILSNAADLLALHTRISADRLTLKQRGCSAAIILGHGTWTKTNDDIPSVAAAEQPLRLKEWLEIGDYRLGVVHSCFGGRVKQKFLGDIGGLPGLVLGISCRLLCAPVAEVPVDAAQVLHEHLLAKDGPREFGLRYLAAVAQEPSVALYNLYGFANEPVA